jgi:predicted Zn-dependent peptidase
VAAVHAALADAFAAVRTQFSDPQALLRAQERAQDSLALSGLRPADRARQVGEWALFARPGADQRELPARLRSVRAADLKRVADRCLAQEYVGVQMPE